MEPHRSWLVVGPSFRNHGRGRAYNWFIITSGDGAIKLLHTGRKLAHIIGAAPNGVNRSTRVDVGTCPIPWILGATNVDAATIVLKVRHTVVSSWEYLVDYVSMDSMIE